MATTSEEGSSAKGLVVPTFSGNREDYKNWVTKFDSYAAVKKFYAVMKGDKVPPPHDQEVKSKEEEKIEEMNIFGYAYMINAMNMKGKAFGIVANAKTTELPTGSCALAYKGLKDTYAPGTVAECVEIDKDFRNCSLKNVKTDPDTWFNELDDYKYRLGSLGTTVSDEQMMAHILGNVPTQYGPMIQMQQALLQSAPAQVNVQGIDTRCV
jgi:hypothetical protein